MAKSGRSAAARRKNTRRSGNPAPQERPASQAVPHTPPATTYTPPTVRANAPSASKPLDPSVQYKFVLGDLKQLGITAAVMFLVLIALAFIIR